MEQKPSLSHAISAIKQLKRQVSGASNTPLDSPTIQQLLSTLKMDSEIPREPICVGDESIYVKRCGDNARFLEGNRKFKVSSQAVAVSDIENSDGDVFTATISAHPMYCIQGLHGYDDHLPTHALYSIDWYFEIYQKIRTVDHWSVQKNSLGRRQFYHLMRRQFFKFGEASFDAIDLQPAKVLREVAFAIYSEIQNRIDEVSIGDEISKKRVQRIVDLNIKRIADEIRFNGEEEKAKWLNNYEY